DRGLEWQWTPLKTPLSIGLRPQSGKGSEERHARLDLERPQVLVEERLRLDAADSASQARPHSRTAIPVSLSTAISSPRACLRRIGLSSRRTLRTGHP